MASEESIAAKDTDIVLKMARKLGVDIHALEKRAARETCRTFPEYRKIRDTYLEIQGLIETLEERSPRVLKRLPGHFPQWLVRAKLKALSVFAGICHSFVSDPPLALSHSFTARDVLTAERGTFTESLSYFDQMLMEAGIDDRTADVLDATRTLIEETLVMIDRLLNQAPQPLEEF